MRQAEKHPQIPRIHPRGRGNGGRGRGDTPGILGGFLEDSLKILGGFLIDSAQLQTCQRVELARIGARDSLAMTTPPSVPPLILEDAPEGFWEHLDPSVHEPVGDEQSATVNSLIKLKLNNRWAAFASLTASSQRRRPSLPSLNTAPKNPSENPSVASSVAPSKRPTQKRSSGRIPQGFFRDSSEILQRL